MSAPVTDEELVAFLHGELEPGRAAEVEAALNDDPELAVRAETLDRQDELVRQAFAPILDAPVPAGMTNALLASDSDPDSNIVSLAEARKARVPRSMSGWGWPQFGAMAASLALGIFAGPALLGGGDGASRSLVVADSGHLAMTPALVAVFDSAASGERVEVAGLGQLQVDISFRDLDSNLCRQAQLSQGDATHDLVACRSASGWQVEALGTRSAGAGEFRTASGDAAPAVVAAVDAMIDGDPLVGEDERAALEQ